MAMAKISNEEKLKAIKVFLRENNVDFIENYHSKNFNLDMSLCIKGLMIAVFLSDDDHDYEDGIYHKRTKNGKRPFYTMYNPFFIRKSDTKKFVLEKMQNCIVNRMMMLQRKWQKEQKKTGKK